MYTLEPMAGRHTLYGNQNGLPGLPKTNYITRKPVRQAPRYMPPPTPSPAPRPQQIRPVIQYIAPPPPPPPPLMPAGPDPFVTRRMDMLEQRLNSSEQSNRALMDELMRLQQDMKMQLKQNEMGLNDERESKGRLEIAVRQSQGQQYEMDDKIRRCEEGVKEQRAAVQQLSGHIQSIEKLTQSIQMEKNDKNNKDSNKLQEYRNELLKATQGTEELERYCASLREDNRATQNQLETVKRDLVTLQSNVKLQARLLEDNAKEPRGLVKMHGDTGKLSETERMVVEGKIISLNNTIQDLTERLSAEAKKREKAENELNARINGLMSEYGRTKIEKDKELREVDDKLKELQEGFSQAEKQRILMEISSVANDLQRKMDNRDTKLRDDTVNKLTVLEKTLFEENKRRKDEEKKLNEKVDKQVKQMEMMGEGSTSDLKKVFDKHEAETRERIGDVTKRMNDVEDSLRKHKMESERILTAEINERQNEDNAIEAKVDDLEDRLAIGLKTMQVALGELKGGAGKQGADGGHGAAAAAAKPASADHMKELQQMQADNESSIRKHVATEVGQLDKRLKAVEMQAKQQDDKIASQLQAAQDDENEAKAMMGDKMQTQIDGIAFKQAKLEKQVEDLKVNVQDTPKGLDKIREDVTTMETKLKKKLDTETKERKTADEELRDDIDKIIGNREVTVPSLAQIQTDVDATQTGMKKLAEAVHVVKTSLMERIKDEKKLREQETTILKRDVERLDTKYHDINERIKSGDVLDPEDDDLI